LIDVANCNWLNIKLEFESQLDDKDIFYFVGGFLLSLERVCFQVKLLSNVLLSTVQYWISVATLAWLETIEQCRRFSFQSLIEIGELSAILTEV
jgi:hypothetical protein